MKTCVIDLETFWDTGHSLKTKGMHPIKYIMSSNTDVISLAYKFGDDNTEVIFGERAVTDFVANNDWSDCLVIGHNMAGFDGPLLAWRFGMNPKMWGCTMAMARPFYQSTIGVSLKAIAQDLGIGEKGSLEATNTKGKRLQDFRMEEIIAMSEYNKLDVDLCHAAFKHFAPLTSKAEAQLIDATIRMATEPKFELDMGLIQRTLEEEGVRKQQMLSRLKIMLNESCTDAVFRTGFASAPKFAKLLTTLGAEVPMKPSPSNPDKQIPALSKTDQGLLDLLEDENELIAAAASARLDVKSTILETRLEKFKEVGDLMEGKMPIALNYHGAISARWSGAFSMNHQNLPRIDQKKPKPTDSLRNSLKAPEGHKVVVVDSSQIELRANHFLWQVPSSMALFQADPEKADLYVDFASKLYKVPTTEVTKQQRQVGKVAHLGLGYGAGWKTFKKVAKLMGGVVLTDEESLDIVNTWRAAYPEIPVGWKKCQYALMDIYRKFTTQIDPWGICHTHPEGIRTAAGMIRYPGLHMEKNDKGENEWWYGTGRNRARQYGPKICENLVQNLARQIVAEQLLEVNKRYNVKHTTHDELVCIVPESEVEDCLAYMLQVMRTQPKWWPELVLWAEGGYGDTFGDAK